MDEVGAGLLKLSIKLSMSMSGNSPGFMKMLQVDVPGVQSKS